VNPKKKSTREKSEKRGELSPQIGNPEWDYKQTKIGKSIRKGGDQKKDAEGWVMEEVRTMKTWGVKNGGG